MNKVKDFVKSHKVVSAAAFLVLASAMIAPFKGIGENINNIETTIAETTTVEEITTVESTTVETTTEEFTTEEETTVIAETTTNYVAESVNENTLVNLKYSGDSYVIINDNIPYFTTSEYTTKSFEYYGDLDSFGRCTVACACIGTDIMPTEERGEIGSVKPTGWHLVKYDIVSGKYLYNRCHLIGYQLSAENANNKNLITGTRYLNMDGMLQFEDMVADYVKETNNHVLYRVTPIFDGNNLLASGVLMEAYSVEDDGDGICFCVYCFNVQPGVVIDYATGDSYLAEEGSTEATTESAEEKNDTVYVAASGKGTKYHSTDSCRYLKNGSTAMTEEKAISGGYTKCSGCW